MDDALSMQHAQGLQQGEGEATDQRHAEALEVVLLDQFIQIHAVGKKKKENDSN